MNVAESVSQKCRCRPAPRSTAFGRCEASRIKGNVHRCCRVDWMRGKPHGKQMAARKANGRHASYFVGGPLMIPSQHRPRSLVARRLLALPLAVFLGAAGLVLPGHASAQNGPPGFSDLAEQQIKTVVN